MKENGDHLFSNNNTRLLETPKKHGYKKNTCGNCSYSLSPLEGSE